MRTTLAFFLLVFYASLNAQNFEWAKSMGGSQVDRGWSICSDNYGNVYSTGVFRQTADFDPGPNIFNLSAYGGTNDIYIQKLDPSGAFLWAKLISGPTSNSVGAGSITTDNNWNVYTVGHYQWTVDFDPGPGISNLTAVGSSDIFIQKLDPTGNLIWAKSVGGSASESCSSVWVDDSSNIFMTGSFGGTTDFDPGPNTFNLSSTGNADIYILKLDPLGNFLWAKSMGGISDDYSTSVSLDASKDIYISGFFYGTADFDPSTNIVNLTSAGGQDIFIVKLNSSGNFIGAKTFGGSNAEVTYSHNSNNIDNSNNIYTTGYFRGTVDFDPGPNTFQLTSQGSFQDVFIQKMDASGNFLWAKSISGSITTTSIGVDNSSNVYTTGIFNGSVDFDPDTGAFISNSSAGNVFIHKLDSLGNFKWAQFINGGISRAIHINDSNNIYLTGNFGSAAVDFNPGPDTNILTSVGDYDAFVLKLSQQVTTSIVKNHTKTNFQLFTYPNPSQDIVKVRLDETLQNVELELRDISGKLIYQKRFTTLLNTEIELPTSSGIYFLSLKTPKEVQIVKLLKE